MPYKNMLVLGSLFMLVRQCQPRQKPSAVNTRPMPMPITINNSLIKSKLDSFIASHDTTNSLFVIWVNNRKKNYTSIIITGQGPNNYPCYFITGYPVPVALNVDLCGGDTILYQHPAEVTRRLEQQQLAASRATFDSTSAIMFVSFRVPGHASVQNGQLFFK
jgi:hypothetical protein